MHCYTAATAAADENALVSIGALKRDVSTKDIHVKKEDVPDDLAFVSRRLWWGK